MLKKNSKIFLAGHNGMVGSAILQALKKKGFKKIITVEKNKLNLIDQNKVLRFLKKNKPDFVIIAAAKVGGILANNNYKAEFLYQNLMIQTNLIHSSFLSNIKNLIFLGSSCIYPKKSKQPIKESELLTGKLEQTNDAYAIAKIAGIKMCESYSKQYNLNYKALMPTNMWGLNDNYNLKTSHFFPALIKKIHHAKIKKNTSITLWGNGKAKRELLYAGDFANACIFFMKKKTKESFINIGSGIEKDIIGYANFIMKKLKISLKINFDKKKPNGVKRKILDLKISKKYGWKSQTNLDQAFEIVYKDFLKNHSKRNLR
jgi:GDP-L-fucose synthase